MTKPDVAAQLNATNDMLTCWWYYSLEVQPGVFTPGQNFDSVSLVRKLLAGVAVEGEMCLDIGCMDGMVSFLMARRGGVVTAWDRIDHSEKFGWLKSQNAEAFPLRFHWNVQPLRRLAKSSKICSSQGYRVVIFAGVLYHVLDPLASLLYARACCQDGGIVIVETAAVGMSRTVPGCALHFNADGYLYPAPGSANYWLPSLECLGQMLRIARLEVLGSAWFAQSGGVVRVAYACRAVDHDIGSDWDLQRNVSENHRLTVGEFIDWQTTRSDCEPVAYVPQNVGELSGEDRKRLSVLRLGDLV